MESVPARNVVLCVDDEEAIRCLLELALEPFGYVPLVASNGREALRLAAQHRLDAVILDYCMPEMNGGEVALENKAPSALMFRSFCSQDHRTYRRAH